MVDFNIDINAPVTHLTSDRLRIQYGQNVFDVKVYNKCIGFFAYLFNIASKVKTADGKVYYVNANSFAKGCPNPNLFYCNKNMQLFIGKVQKPLILSEYKKTFEKLLTTKTPENRALNIRYFDAICSKINSDPSIDANGVAQALETCMLNDGKDPTGNVIKPNWALHYYAKGQPKSIFNQQQPQPLQPLPSPNQQPFPSAPMMGQNAAPQVPALWQPLAFRPDEVSSINSDVALGSPLASNYQWPSDHFPVAGSINFAGRSVGFASYNVLSDQHMDHITKPDATQGLKGSLITTLSPADRNKLIARQVLEMITHPTHPKECFAIQECSRDALTYIQECLPFGYGIYASPNIQPSNDGGVLVYKQTLHVQLTQSKQFSGNKYRYIDDFLVTDIQSGAKMRLINTHVFQNNFSELASYLEQNPALDNIPILLMGDMNQPTSVINASLQGKNFTAYCLTGSQATHVNGYNLTQDYDQVYYIATRNAACNARASHHPREIFPVGESQYYLEHARRLLKGIVG